ncbi:hypothetical protein CSC94_10115 [Zhengella mangrovi]|uniref:Beta-lactamase-related domain-containing protein n=1 Tax=Zhengella mangrovi TaxID=1982044 RepID=A0A2G1QPJ6_9HYPH|nr:ankyrin repeat domain-containing protein [Zhengella mangrovi]PHP67380.1 hypothetical protein CSC94_10115 [Zhengella mangrovi]
MTFLSRILAIALVCLFPTVGPAASQSLHAAILQGHADEVRRMLDSGSDINSADAYGSTPLTVAATFGRTEIARMLIAAGANLEATDGQGSAPLHIAAFLGRTEIVTALLAGGADRYQRNGDGSSALDIAAADFDDDLPVYAGLGNALKPLGLVLDLPRIRAARQTIAAMLAPTSEMLADVRFDPVVRAGDWPVASPQEAGLDRQAMAALYLEASHLANLWGLLVIRDGTLVGEAYFHEGGIEQASTRHSITKSFLSALYGIAVEKGCAPDLDAPLLSQFPEMTDAVRDDRKRAITFRQMLKMRAGFPMEINSPQHHDALFMSGKWNWIGHIADFPLLGDPGTRFGYSNLTSQLLAIALARACDTDLEPFARQNLFEPIGATLANWTKGPLGYRIGWGEMSIPARSMARFGQLYLDGGTWKSRQVVPADWVRSSLASYTQNAWTTPKLGRYLRDIGYGYQWWSARAGQQDIHFAWGHGGQLIALVPALGMVVVTTADPQLGLDPIRDPGWERELAIINVVGHYISGLPKG